MKTDFRSNEIEDGNEWFELILHIKDGEDVVEGIGNFLIEEGFEGLLLEDLWVQNESIQKENERGTRIRAYFRNDPSFNNKIQRISKYIKSLSAIFPERPPVHFFFRPLKKTDWIKEFRESFKGTRVTESITIRPSWEMVQNGKEEGVIIVIDPGGAFGTGLHPSTRLTLEAIEETLRALKLRNIRALDVGTGTGILAIASVKMGAYEVIAIDLDKAAAMIASTNALRNECQSRIRVVNGTIESIRGKFQLIISNIDERFHEENLLHYWNSLEEGGWIIISGFLVENAKDLIESFEEIGFSLEREKELEGWSSLIFRKI